MTDLTPPRQGDPIWIIDEVVAKPGRGEAFLDAYMARYAPGARRRGLTLAHRMVEPAFWLEDASNRLLLVWTAPDAGAVWTGKHMARSDADVLRWWEEEAPEFIVSRRRAVLAEADAIAGLSDV